jgi:hypothetical protein
MENTYKVRFFQDETYEVTEEVQSDEYYGGYGEESVFQGSLSDCEAWIRLHEKGYM